MSVVDYKTLVLSQSQEFQNHFSTLSESISIKYAYQKSVMDSLEYLIDNKIDFIIVDAHIGKENFLNFYKKIMKIKKHQLFF